MSITKMNIKQITLKSSSKKEIYRMLQLEGDVYLPPLSQANHTYVAGVISGRIKYVKNSCLKAIQVPHLENLRVQNILAFARTKFSIDKYLPQFKNDDKVPGRTWLCNLINTVIPEEFKSFVMEGVKKSELKHVTKKKFEIDVSLEFATMFKQSEIYSRVNGRFSKLLNSRKRKHHEIEEKDKTEHENKDLEKEFKKKQSVIEDLISKVNQFESERIKLLEDQSKLAKLYEMGVIDDHGDPLPFDQRE